MTYDATVTTGPVRTLSLEEVQREFEIVWQRMLDEYYKRLAVGLEKMALDLERERSGV